MKPVTALAAALLAGIGALHVMRLVGRVQVLVDGVAVPMWASAVAALVSLGLAAGVWREHRGPGGAS